MKKQPQSDLNFYDENQNKQEDSEYDDESYYEEDVQKSSIPQVKQGHLPISNEGIKKSAP